MPERSSHGSQASANHQQDDRFEITRSQFSGLPSRFPNRKLLLITGLPSITSTKKGRKEKIWDWKCWYYSLHLWSSSLTWTSPALLSSFFFITSFSSCVGWEGHATIFRATKNRSQSTAGVSFFEHKSSKTCQDKTQPPCPFPVTRFDLYTKKDQPPLMLSMCVSACSDIKPREINKTKDNLGYMYVGIYPRGSPTWEET